MFYHCRWRALVLNVLTNFLCGVCMFSPSTLACLYTQKNMQVRLTSDFKLLVDVNVRVNGCLSVYYKLDL